MNLHYKKLLQNHALINGKWIASASHYPVRNPATQELLAEVAHCGVKECDTAILAAELAFPILKNLLAQQRAQLLESLAKLMLQHSRDLATIISSEQGKSLAEAQDEVSYAASFITWFAEEARRIYGDIIQSHRPHSKILLTKNPIGVVAAITPWNFPLAMFTRKFGAAIAAGCPVIWKPAEETPLSALALGVLSLEAGFPAGVLNIISGDAVAIGATLMKAQSVRKISFTGSTATGKLLLQQAAATVKRVSLELGGNAPFIVFADADLAATVKGAMACKFRNSGQTCISVNRFYIHNTLYDEFVAQLAIQISQLKVGNGLTHGVTLGPLINQQSLNKVIAHVQDASAKGGNIICGGKLHQLGGTFYEPTLIANANSSMLLAKEETFGPIAACFSFSDEDEVIAAANHSTSGLAAYFYTKDLARAIRVADALDVGMVGINDSAISNVIAPFGGVKESGFGREGSKYGIDDYLTQKYILLANG